MYVLSVQTSYISIYIICILKHIIYIYVICILIIYYRYKTFISFYAHKKNQLCFMCFVYWSLKLRLQNLFYSFELITISVMTFLICILWTS